MHPDLDWLEQTLFPSSSSTTTSPEPSRVKQSIKLVVVVNPCNPTGVLLSQEEVDRLTDMTARAGMYAGFTLTDN